MKPFFRMIFAICALLLTRTVVAEEEDPFEIAMFFSSEENVEGNEDLESIRQAAERGNPEAQNRLGRFYAFGVSGVPLDRKEAVKWFRKAADRGNAEAQYNLGCCCEYGKGARKDLGKAAEQYRLAAEQGYVPAQFQYAACLQRGKGVLEDKYEAVKWYRKAAEQGHVNAQVNLAFCYEKGIGVEKDENLARKWLHKASAQGDEKGQEKLLLMDDETVSICFHHPSLIVSCSHCGKAGGPIFGIHDYKGENYDICADCLKLPHCQFCRAPVADPDEDDGLCRDCSREAINDPLVGFAVFQEVRETLFVQYKMFTEHEIVFDLGTRDELELRHEDDPQKMSVYGLEMIDGAPMYTIRILKNLPLDIFRIAAAEAIAQDWLEENLPQAMADPDIRDGFSLYIARLLAKKEHLPRTKTMVKKLMEDGRYVTVSKLVQNKTAVGEWRKALKSQLKEENRKMPVRVGEQTENSTAQKRAGVIKENEERNEVREKPKAAANALIYPRGLPDRPSLRPQQSNRVNDLSNTQTLLRNGLRREHQTVQLPPPSNRETDLSSTQKVLQNGLRRKRKE